MHSTPCASFVLCMAALALIAVGAPGKAAEDVMVAEDHASMQREFADARESIVSRESVLSGKIISRDVKSEGRLMPSEKRIRSGSKSGTSKGRSWSSASADANAASSASAIANAKASASAHASGSLVSAHANATASAW
jgi:hypothetical protein